MKEVGIGTRVLNFLVDTVLIFFISFGLYKWWSFYVMYWHFKFFPFYIFFAATIVFYYTIFESIWSRTPGKFVSMTKVRTASGGKAAWYRIILRSIIRITVIDCFFIPFIGRTLHDALSNTRVVEA